MHIKQARAPIGHGLWDRSFKQNYPPAQAAEENRAFSSPKTLLDLSWDLKGLRRGGPAIPLGLGLWRGMARSSPAALPSAPAALRPGRPRLRLLAPG